MQACGVTGVTAVTGVMLVGRALSWGIGMPPFFPHVTANSRSDACWWLLGLLRLPHMLLRADSPLSHCKSGMDMSSLKQIIHGDDTLDPSGILVVNERKSSDQCQMNRVAALGLFDKGGYLMAQICITRLVDSEIVGGEFHLANVQHPIRPVDE